MPSVVEIPIDVAKITTSPNRSDIIAVNNHQRATLLVQTSAPLSAGKWALRSALTPDASIPGGVVAETLVVPDIRVHRVSADVCDKWIYVEQTEAPAGGTVQAITVLLR